MIELAKMSEQRRLGVHLSSDTLTLLKKYAEAS
jgi:hypothetical protein